MPSIPPPAEAVEDVEVSSTVAPEEEAASVAEALETAEESTGINEVPTIASYEVRFADEGHVDSGLRLVSEFPLPENCVSSAAAESLRCDGGDVMIEPVALTVSGDTVPITTAVTDTGIVVTTDPLNAETAHILTMYVSASKDADLLPIAADAFAWMVAAEGSQSGGDAPFPDEEEGEWTEEDSDAEAPPDEIGEEWVPADDEFDESAGEPTQPPLIAYGSFTRPKQVKVPSNYVYCSAWITSRCRPKALHDYCTWSPDGFAFAYAVGAGTMRVRASFKGPCARHDLAIDSIRKKTLSLSSKRSQRASADTRFKSHLRQNCAYSLYKTKAGRVKCYDRAALYYSKVADRTKGGDGK